MPTRGDTQINSFVKGLVTEASPLSFPPNTALDILNFRLNKDGTNFRRLGLDFEDGYLLTATGYSSDVLATARKAFYHWQLPNGEPLVDIGVVQIGAKFWFLNLYAESPSAALLNGGNAVTAAVDPSSKFSFAVINNYLLVVSNNLPDPYLVSYDYALDAITFESSPILVRDMWGVDDGIDVGYRPTTLTPAHYYNLLNQGWSNEIVSTCTPAGISAIDCTQITLGVYPSNSDVWTIGRIGDLTSADVHKYDPNIAARNIFNIGQVPQGHYILRLKDRGAERQLQTGLSVPLDREIGTISCVAAYAGRAFYSGILSQIEGGDKRSPILSGAVLFSQTFEQKIQLVRCYQEADPTSPDISDILDTDGGIIFIPECSVVNHLRAVKESLLVFAINGIWEIKGTEGGFTANSFQVHKISNVGVYSPDSIVEINGQILFWGINGIYALAQNQFGVWETNSITKPTIQKMYDSIPDFARSQAKGYYDLNRNTVRWLYYSDDAKVVGQAIDVTPPPTPAYRFEAGAVTTGASLTGRAILVALAADKYMIIYQQSSAPSDLLGVICNVNTTTLAVTINTPVTISTAGASNIDYVDAKLLTTNKVAVNYLESGTGNDVVNILTVSGNTFTVGVANNLGIAGTKTYPRISVLTSTTLLHTYNKQAGSFFTFARVLTIAGDVVTPGAETATPASTGDGQHLARLSNTSGLLVATHSTFANALYVLSVSGGLVTYNTPLSLENPIFQAANTNQYYFESNSTGTNIPIIAHSIFESPNNAMLRIIKVSGTTVTSENSSEYYTSGVTITSNGFSKIIPMTDGIAAFVLTENDASEKLYCGVVDYTSATITSKTLPTVIHSGESNYPFIVKLSDTLMAWVCHTNSNVTKTGVVRVGVV